MKKITCIILSTFLCLNYAPANQTIQINQNEFVQLKREFFIHKESHNNLKKIVYCFLIALSIVGIGIVTKKLKNKGKKRK